MKRATHEIVPVQKLRPGDRVSATMGGEMRLVVSILWRAHTGVPCWVLRTTDGMIHPTEIDEYIGDGHTVIREAREAAA